MASTTTPVEVVGVADRATCLARIEDAWDRGAAVWVLDPEASPTRRRAMTGGLLGDTVLDRVASRGHAVADLAVPADTATIVTTSGTTGPPTVLALSTAALDASADGADAHLAVGPDDRWLLVLPLHHVAGQSVAWRARRLGHRALVQQRLDPPAAAAAGVTVVSLVPTQLRRLVDGGHHLDATVLLGGGAISPSLLADTAAGSHVTRVVRSYGLTETAGGCVYDGRPFDGVEVTAPDDRLRVRGPVLASGRLTTAGLRPIVDGDGWLATNDRGRVAPDGQVAVFGRADDVIISGGVNVDPAAVEVVLEDDPAIDRAGVVGRPDHEWGEVVVAVVTATSGPPDIDDLQARVRDHLGAAAVPRTIEVVDDLHLTALGKVDRARLRAHRPE